MSAPARFRTLRKFLAPRWLTEGDGELVGYALDLLKDAWLERLRLGLLARFPSAGPGGQTAPPDALIAQGRDRRVVRGISETDAAYAARLVTWLDDRPAAGNPFAMMRELAAYTGTGCVFKIVDNSSNWFVRAADGTQTAYLSQANWDWDGHADRWSRFWVIVHPPASLWTARTDTWGDPDWGTIDGTWGSTAPADQVQTMRAIVADWKPAGTRCVNIIVAFDPASFSPSAAVSDSGMPDGLWGAWSRVVGGVQVPARLDTARYWDGS